MTVKLSVDVIKTNYSLIFFLYSRRRILCFTKNSHRLKTQIHNHTWKTIPQWMRLLKRFLTLIMKCLFMWKQRIIGHKGPWLSEGWQGRINLCEFQDGRLCCLFARALKKSHFNAYHMKLGNEAMLSLKICFQKSMLFLSSNYHLTKTIVGNQNLENKSEQWILMI